MIHLGLDVGTSGIKAGVFDETGALLGFAKEKYALQAGPHGERELDAGLVWQAAKTVLWQAAKESGLGRKIKTITVSSLGEAMVLMDETGAPLEPSILGTDVRGLAEMEELLSAVGRERLIALSGHDAGVVFSINKLMFLKKHHTEHFEKAKYFAKFQDYMVFRLSGERMIDYSLAGRTMAMDIHKKQWAEDVLLAAGVKEEKLSRLCLAGTPAGTIRPALAEKLGISKEATIVVGTHDHVACALGAGAVRPGDVSLAMGTGIGYTGVMGKQCFDEKTVMQYQTPFQPFVLPDTYNLITGVHTGGVLLHWFYEQFAKGRFGITGFDDSFFSAMESMMSDHPTDILFDPSFSGSAAPTWDALAKGAYINLTMGTTLGDLYQATLEGITCELNQMQALVKKAGFPVKQLRATGGGARSQAWLHMIADILDTPVITLECQEAGVLGNAIMGAAAAGDYQDIPHAVSHMVKEKETILPDEKQKNAYLEKKRKHQLLYEALKPLRMESGGTKNGK